MSNRASNSPASADTLCRGLPYLGLRILAPFSRAYANNPDSSNTYLVGPLTVQPIDTPRVPAFTSYLAPNETGIIEGFNHRPKNAKLHRHYTRPQLGLFPSLCNYSGLATVSPIGLAALWGITPRKHPPNIRLPSYRLPPKSGWSACEAQSRYPS